MNILTVGVFTYTNDKRFQALHSTGSSEWTLKILAPKLEDSGVYECQVSTEPKLSRAFMLDVVGESSQSFRITKLCGIFKLEFIGNYLIFSFRIRLIIWL